MDGQSGFARHFERALGRLALGDELGEDQRFHFAHGEHYQNGEEIFFGAWGEH